MRTRLLPANCATSTMLACYDPEGWRAASHLRPWDLTPCFEEGIILPIFYLALILFAVLRTISLTFRPKKPRSRTSVWILRVKIVLLSLACVVSLANIAHIATRHQIVPVLMSYILEPIAILTAIPLTYFNHYRTRRSSTILLIYWPLYTIALIIWARTAGMISVQYFRPIIGLRCTSLGLGLLALVLECICPEKQSFRGNKIGLDTKENPVAKANLYSALTFSFWTPLLAKGAKDFVTEQDTPPMLPGDDSEELGGRLEKAMSKHSFWMSLTIAFGGRYGFCIFLKLVADILTFAQPQLLRLLLNFISKYQQVKERKSDGMWLWPGTNAVRVWIFSSSSTPPLIEGFTYAILMFLVGCAYSLVMNQCFKHAFEAGMRMRTGVITAVYNKSLRLSNDERNRRNTGDIVNLMSVDGTRVQDFCQFGMNLVSGPFQIILAFISLYALLGWPSLVGVGIMVVMVPLNSYFAALLKSLQVRQMNTRDQRTRLMTEMLNNIRSIKLYGWEFAFTRRILEVRNDVEMKTLKKIGVTLALNLTIFQAAPVIVSFATFAVSALATKTVLTPSVVFPALALFNLLMFPLSMFSQTMSSSIEASVSIKRLSEYLGAEEMQEDARKIIHNRDFDEVLSIRKADFSWSKQLVVPTLEDIDLSIRRGELVGVLGKVGSGKTSILAAIIGDMTRIEGSLSVAGSIAYAQQSPWVMSSTVRDNILFSHEFDERYYNLVIEACALKPDLELLPFGDLTEVGEKGITLSGGQRARVSLARAVYSRADLVLLDDVLAAVDSHVAKHIFDNVIGPHGLLAGRARILVTNSVAFVSQFDKLVYMRLGRVVESGSYLELMATPGSQVPRLVGHATSGAATPTRSGAMTPRVLDEDQYRSGAEGAISSATLKGKLRELEAKPKVIIPDLTRSIEDATGLSKEHSAQGSMGGYVWREYIRSASTVAFILVAVANLAQQGINLGCQFVLRAWSEYNQGQGRTSLSGRFLGIYAGMGVAQILMSLAGGLLLLGFCTLRSARKLHDKMLYAVMQAPLLFFEVTPMGRVINLFSRDTYIVDELLGRVAAQFALVTSVTLSIVVVIIVAFWISIVFVIPLAWFYVHVMRYYLKTSQEVQRLDAMTRSPVFAWFSETLSGLSTIRAYEQEDVFRANNLRRLDRNQTCYYSSISLNRWLSVRLELVGNLLIVLVAVLSMIFLVKGGVDSGLVGLVLSWALSATQALSWVVRHASEWNQHFVSVERILHQSEIAPEAPLEIPDTSPGDTWPTNGSLEFRGYSARYRPDLDLVLRDISITINPREKVGVCGRTGAGKSSLLLALFRIIEPAEGSIILDGVDITKIGLHDLRSSISIVPQSPDLFSGTLRENIDPLGQHPDADIWTALSQSHLKKYVEGLPAGLDAMVGEGGSALSSGQRQLLCFARALLRKSKVLVLDEATSAVDLDTDQDIQEIIRGPAFMDVTILTIAHRLNTIIDSDRVLVMDTGKVAEFDSPDALLAKKDSIFYSLAKEAGLVESE